MVDLSAFVDECRRWKGSQKGIGGPHLGSRGGGGGEISGEALEIGLQRSKDKKWGRV